MYPSQHSMRNSQEKWSKKKDKVWQKQVDSEEKVVYLHRCPSSTFHLFLVPPEIKQSKNGSEETQGGIKIVSHRRKCFIIVGNGFGGWEGVGETLLILPQTTGEWPNGQPAPSRPSRKKNPAKMDWSTHLTFTTLSQKFLFSASPGCAFQNIGEYGSRPAS